MPTILYEFFPHFWTYIIHILVFYGLGMGKRPNTHNFLMFYYKLYMYFQWNVKGNLLTKDIHKIFSIALYILCLNYREIYCTRYTVETNIFTHRVHRVAMTTFWRTYHHDGKISPACMVTVGRARPPPFNVSTITSKVVVYTPAERADTLPLPPSVYFSSTPICTLCLYLPQVDPAAV
jgi:hypothetical protein